MQPTIVTTAQKANVLLKNEKQIIFKEANIIFKEKIDAYAHVYTLGLE